MTERFRRISNIGIAGLIMASGGAVCAWFIHTKPLPARRAGLDQVFEVLVQSAEAGAEQTPVVGHGSVRAKNQINIIPQVSGRLTEVHRDLAQGKIIPKGELLFQIDPTVYDARVRQAEAETRGLEATLARHDQEAANLDARIGNGEQMLAIDEEDYRTSRHLYEVEKVGTQRDVDLIHQKYLKQKDMLAELTNRRAMVPHVRLETLAQLDAARARLTQTQHDLENTGIRCPFRARIEAVHAFRSQVVTAHFSIGTLTDMEAFEISVGIDPRELRWLDQAVRPEVLGGTELSDGPEVRVRWSLHGENSSWRGHVTRFERVDEATRTARMVVEVRQADMTASVGFGNGSGPSLSIGMYCETELPAERLEDALRVPRHAIYDNRWVYVFEPDSASADGRTGRLARREVPMLRAIGDAVLVDYRSRDSGEVCELAAGDEVIVSPLSKPVLGMRIRKRNNEAASASGGSRDSLLERLANSGSGTPRSRIDWAVVASHGLNSTTWELGPKRVLPRAFPSTLHPNPWPTESLRIPQGGS